jgi:Heterokaryon incompatibility protein (HET)
MESRFHEDMQNTPRDEIKILDEPEDKKHARSTRSTKSKLQDGRLCQRCRTIDFDVIFNMSPKGISQFEGFPIMHLGDLGEDDPDTLGCSLCHLLRTVRPRPMKRFLSKSAKDGYHLRAFPRHGALYNSKSSSRKLKSSGIVLGVLHGRPRRRSFEGYTCLANGMIAPLDEDFENSDSGLFRIRELTPKITSYDQIRNWLAHCQVSHKWSCDLANLVRPPKMRFIDCLTRDIVPISDDQEYVTLSYVWGPSQPTTLSQAEFATRLPSSGVPVVVEDAMLVVKGLGYRYLWVDRYCIDQWDSEAKESQIKNMHHIYEGACITIVAAPSSSADKGLPGVGGSPRQQQINAVIGQRRLVSTSPHVSVPLGDSTWITRGWTYQEAILSRRCLFFTDVQVYFVCKSMTCRESIEGPISGSLPLKLDETTLGPLQLGKSTLGTDVFSIAGPTPSDPFSRFMNHVSQYSSRRLTYETDALDAFRGSLARQEYCTYYGVPICFDYDRLTEDDFNACDLGFARGLCWTPSYELSPQVSTPLRRREGFPSWSWVGWSGEIGFFHDPDDEAIRVKPGSCDINFEIEGTSGSLFSLHSLHLAHASKLVVPELSLYLQFDACIVQVRFQRSGPGNAYVFVCARHLDSECDCGSWDRDEAGYPLFCEGKGPGSTFAMKALSHRWDAIYLFRIDKSSGWLRVILMLIEWHGDTAERVGLLELDANIYEKLPKQKRRIRLG